MERTFSTAVRAPSWSFEAQATITAFIYAPEAALTLVGGGSDYYHSVGAFYIYSVKLTGNMAFHYDEAFKILGPQRGFIPIGWQEL